MELRELAERVLFGDTLEDKLCSAAEITDVRPGTAITAPGHPGRPQALRIKATRSDEKRPGRGDLERDEPRARLLHQFANHELLATELMALVLLKFPDAPSAFRKGILRTMRDEQEHTRLYLERLAEMGVAFGDYPVSGFFWQTVADMATPLDYVSRLSLTFEQANLDFARHFGALFEEVGDKPSAKLMARIYKDEIAHVGYGLKWFRRWKEPGKSDWEAFNDQMVFPLSPNRAKGLDFNAEGRRKAGLDDEFIANLRIYSKSRGRTPRIYYFNPLAEWEISAGRSFSPNKFQQALVADLANLPQFLAGQDDVVLVPEAPSGEFLSSLHDVGFLLPEFEILVNGLIVKDSELRGRKLAGLRPWAWSPASVQVLEPLFEQQTAECIPAAQRWNRGVAQLYSKSWSADRMREVGDALDWPEWLCEPDDVGQFAGTEEDVMEIVRRLRERFPKLVAKAPLGLAGHDMQRLWEPELLPTQRAWIAQTIERQGGVVIEPWRERMLDFSSQWEVEPKRMRRLGLVRMLTDLRGQYQASLCSARFAQGISSELARFFQGERGEPKRLDRVCQEVARALHPRFADTDFVGPVGIDAFVFRDAEGALRLKPIVEINPRYTMGRVALELMKRAAPGSSGCFQIVSRSMLRKLQLEGFEALAARLAELFPRELSGGHLRFGVVCLNDPRRVREYLAVWLVSSQATHLSDVLLK